MWKLNMIIKTVFSILLAVCIVCCNILVSGCGRSFAETESKQSQAISDIPVVPASGNETESVRDNEGTSSIDNAEDPLNLIIWKKITGNSENKNTHQYTETDPQNNGSFIVIEERTEAFDVTDPDNYHPTFIFSDYDPFDIKNSISFVNGEAFVFAEDDAGKLFAQFVKFDPDSIIVFEDGMPLVVEAEDGQPHRLLVTIAAESGITREQLVQISYDMKKP